MSTRPYLAGALTIAQPWASAVFTLGKNVENRSWSFPHRLPALLGIHAGARPMPRALVDHLWPADIEQPDLAALPYKTLLGVVTITDSHLSTLCGEHCKNSPWASDHFAHHWALEDARPLRDPLPMDGFVRIWPLLADSRDALKAARKPRRRK